MKKFYILSLMLVLLDQLTKYFFSFYWEIFSFFSIYPTENTGALFSIFQGYNIVFILVSLVMLPLVIFLFKETPLPMSLILAGISGNLIDRIVFGAVRDFVSIGFWPTFNLADAYITIGVVILAWKMLREEKVFKHLGLQRKNG